MKPDISVIMSVYNGSVKDLAVSLFENDALSDDDIKELRAIFEDREG